MSDNTPLNLPPRRRPPAQQRSQRPWLIAGAVGLVLLCVCAILGIVASRQLLDLNGGGGDDVDRLVTDPDTAVLTVAVSPAMASTFRQLAEGFNAQNLTTADGQSMDVQMIVLDPEKMVEQSLGQPTFQAVNPDSSLWLNQLEQRWSLQQSLGEGTVDTTIPIGTRRINAPVRYATSPVVIAAWESVAQELSWPQEPVGWQQIQRKATNDPNFKWNHPSTSNASGLLATLAEFYAGAGLTRGLTEEAATDEATIDYVREVESTVRFYGEGEEVIFERLQAEGRNFLDAFVVQEQFVLRWNQTDPVEELVAIYPAEGTLWADHPLALLELSGPGETPLADNQRRTYQAFVDYITGAEAQARLLAAGFRPADLSIDLSAPGSPFADNPAVDWRQPQTTLQMPSPAVVEVVQNVWWYTKRPTNVYLVVDTSGSMEGSKLATTQEALKAFIDQMRGDRDQVGLIEFSSGVQRVSPLRRLDESSRAELNEVIDSMYAGGNTALIDAVRTAYTYLLNREDQEAINAIVVMTDGQENASEYSLQELQEQFQNTEAAQIVIFTIGFGKDVDAYMLEDIAEIGGGQFRRADETDIEELYKIISTYF
ncbi:MAG: VWA domain-containing protein [Anaerolineales bacterium]